MKTNQRNALVSLNKHCQDESLVLPGGVLVHFLLPDGFMSVTVFNRAASVRVLLDSKQCDTSFRWMEGEARSDYTGELALLTDNVKRVLMHGLSWYQLKVQDGNFHLNRGGSGRELQRKRSSSCLSCPATDFCAKDVCVKETSCTAFDKRQEAAHRRTMWWPVGCVREGVPTWTTSHGMLGRWPPVRGKGGQRLKVDFGRDLEFKKEVLDTKNLFI